MAKATKYIAGLKVELSWPKNNYLNTKFGCLNFRNVKITKTCDICVNPDIHSELNDKSTVIKNMEYIALGKPIVQFDLKEGKFSSQEASLYAKKGSVKDYREKILELINNESLRRKMGDIGSRRVMDKLDWKYSISNLLNAYKALTLKGGNF